MAKRCGFPRQRVSRIWRAFGLRPHRSESFTLSTDPYFVDKVRHVVGLYLAPPANALVLSVDEKTRAQALERSRPVLPMRPGTPERRTHDDYRHGALSLFAALEVATGRVISATKAKHRSTEFLSFLRQVEKTVPADLNIHAILDNHATHETAAARLHQPRISPAVGAALRCRVCSGKAGPGNAVPRSPPQKAHPIGMRSNSSSRAYSFCATFSSV